MFRILHVIDSLDAGGAETLVAGLVPRLRALGAAADLFLLQGQGTSLERLTEDHGVSVFRGSGSIYSPGQIRHLAQHLSRVRYDIIHVHLFPAQLWSCIAARFVAAPGCLVTTEHSTSNRRRKLQTFRFLDRWMYSHYRAIVCNSEASARSLVEWVGGAGERTRVIYNGIDLALFAGKSRLDKQRLLGTSGPVILCTASLSEKKDHATLLRAVALVGGVHVMLAGSGPLAGKLRELSRRLGILERVHFLGTRDDIPDILGIADIYVQPSIHEGFGIAVLEAMAAGIPVVASAIPGLSEVTGSAALQFQVGNERELAQCLMRLLAEAGLRSELSFQGRLRAAKFSIDETVRRHLSLYETMLQGPRQRAAVD